MKPQDRYASTTDLQPQMVPRTLFDGANEYVMQLEQAADDAFETLLKLYLSPEAFAVLKRYQHDLTETLGIWGEDDSLRGALNDLGCPCGEGLKQLQRTAKAIQKERKAV